MEDAKRKDLRVERTQRAIRQAFHEMVNEGSTRITVKELAERAAINRKTFYLHYESIEALFSEELERILDDFFANFETTPETPEDMSGHAIRFFLYLTQQPPAIERLICTPAYFDDFGDKLYRHQMDRYARAGGDPFEDLPYVSHGRSGLVLSFIRSTALGFYRQWVKDGKTVDPQEAAELLANLTCHGINWLLIDKQFNRLTAPESRNPE
ncbi:hypothetical protein DMP06_06075 [Slackia equolifaciens]|uniref:HTH tetR-type domain-containing protein n=1 Tax=Slackia equolifaciens TaxID=498718 RepID=A0A3N0AYF7_9ACTN|nr:TetR/AcrR family transcriptional regulator [Slackia equolifaciens]RNL39902.1 hypothetical protein DMP06_06075 [Slackia equolifaciens]